MLMNIYLNTIKNLILYGHQLLVRHIPGPDSGNRRGGGYDPVYPDLKLYEEILFLKHYFDGKWIVENVKPYYEPLIKATAKIERHLFWSNFQIFPIKTEKNRIFDGNLDIWQQQFGIDISGYEFDTRKDKILRNCVHPDIGLHILNESKREGLFYEF